MDIIAPNGRTAQVRECDLYLSPIFLVCSNYGPEGTEFLVAVFLELTLSESIGERPMDQYPILEMWMRVADRPYEVEATVERSCVYSPMSADERRSENLEMSQVIRRRPEQFDGPARWLCSAYLRLYGCNCLSAKRYTAIWKVLADAIGVAEK